jgi:hypothetical protein
MRNQLRRLVPVLLLAVACLYTYKLEVTETHTHNAAGINRLDARTQNGAIHVTAVNDTFITDSVYKYAYGRDRADAEDAIENVVYSDTIVGDELRMKAEMPSSGRPYGASLAITAPESTDLSLSTTNDDVSVMNMLGDLSVGTTNGKVALTGTTGTASVSTTNGSIDVKVHSGAFYGATTNGAVDCDIAALRPTEDLGLSTTNGRVTLLLPEDVSALVEVTNTSGFITIYDFTVTYETQDEHHVRARIGSGASQITIVTTNGDVVVRSRS